MTTTPCALARSSCRQVPDIYDSAKYDANHNNHLNLDMRVRAGGALTQPSAVALGWVL